MAEKFKPQYDTAEDVPEAHRDLYEERDGKFVFAGVEGLVEKQRLDEFRTSNIKLQKDIQALRAQFEGIDPDEVKTMREQLGELTKKEQQLQEEQLLKDKNHEELRKQWTKEVVTERDKGFRERDARISTLTERLNQLLMTDQLRSIGVKKKLQDWGVEDLVTIGSQVAALDEHGEPVVYETRNGQRSIVLNDNAEPMTLEEWADKQIAIRPGWLPPSSGGGSHHQSSGSNGAAVPRMPNKPPSQWTTEEKVAFGRRQGWDAWDKLLSQQGGHASPGG